MRLIHTADIHLDLCFAESGMPAGFANRRRQSLRDVFRTIVERAAAWPADVLLIAGDLFEQDRVSRDTIAFLQSTFEAAAPVPVYIAPGNHDPYTPTSPYATEPWPGNVFIFKSPAWSAHELEGVPLTVHGFGFDGPDISANPFGQLVLPQDGRVHVAVAHGSERAHQPPWKTAYAPFDAEDAAVDGLLYLALGHFHATTQIDGPAKTRMYYSGAPEGRNFRESGPHHYLEIEIDDDVRVNAVPSSRIVYNSHSIDCSAVVTAQELIETVRNIAASENLPQSVRITLEGPCATELRNEIPAVYDSAASEFVYLQLIDNTTSPEDYAELAKESTSLGGFIGKLNAEIEDARDEAQRRMLTRTREVGLAAYRGQSLLIRGLERE